MHKGQDQVNIVEVYMLIKIACTVDGQNYFPFKTSSVIIKERRKPLFVLNVRTSMSSLYIYSVTSSYIYFNKIK